MQLAVRVHGRQHRFGPVREVLARANEVTLAGVLAAVPAQTTARRRARS